MSARFPVKKQRDSDSAASLPRSFAIVGAGALGSVFAAFLLRAGHHVSLLGRPSPQATAPPHNLRVELNNGPVVALGHLVTADPSVVAAADSVILLVKVGDTTTALAIIQPFVYSGQQILTLQNGLGSAQRIYDALGDVPRIFTGVTSQAATRPRPDLVQHTGSGLTVLGPSNPLDMPAATALARVLSDAGLPAVAVHEIDRWVWQKVAVNAAINGLTALGSIRNGVIVDDPALLDAAEIVGEEAAAVARAYGTELGNVRHLIAETARSTAANRSSMLQDIDAGRRTEVDAIHGAIVAAGEAVGVATPATQVLASLIRLRERTRA